MWMGMQSVTSLWFSYFLGWLIKFLVVKFGGQSVYLSLRRFMLGIIIGEALAVIFWTIIAWYTGVNGGTYSLEYN